MKIYVLAFLSLTVLLYACKPAQLGDISKGRHIYYRMNSPVHTFIQFDFQEELHFSSLSYSIGPFKYINDSTILLNHHFFSHPNRRYMSFIELDITSEPNGEAPGQAFQEFQFNISYLSNPDIQESWFECKEPYTVALLEMADGSCLGRFLEMGPPLDAYLSRMKTRFPENDADIKNVYFLQAAGEFELTNGQPRVKQDSPGVRIMHDEEDRPYIATECRPRYLPILTDTAWTKISAFNEQSWSTGIGPIAYQEFKGKNTLTATTFKLRSHYDHNSAADTIYISKDKTYVFRKKRDSRDEPYDTFFLQLWRSNFDTSMVYKKEKDMREFRLTVDKTLRRNSYSDLKSH